MKRLIAIFLMLLLPVCAVGESFGNIRAYTGTIQQHAFVEKQSSKGAAKSSATPRPKKTSPSDAPKPDKKNLEARFEAIVIKNTYLRQSPNGARIDQMPENTRVTVHEIEKNWCCVSYRKWTGYVETKNLAQFRSLMPFDYPVPGRTVNDGIVTLKKTVRIEGGRFSGLNASAGTRICVKEAKETSFDLAVWRGSGKIPADSGSYQAFTPWQVAQPGDLIGGFTTYYNKKTGVPLAKQRVYNITLACQRIDGTEVKPNKQFSFNRLCAPYNQHNHYQLANNISAKGVGYGGGVCQLSTTLYNALLALPIQVDAAKVHRKSGVQYVPQWFDAAVSGYSDLKFTNTLPYSIRIWAQPQEGALTVLIYRADEAEASAKGT